MLRRNDATGWKIAKEPIPAQNVRPAKDINIFIDDRGKIQIKGVDVEPAQLGERQAKAMEEANNKNIIINGDGDCPQRYVVFVVDEARAVGVEGIAFAREQEE